MRSWPGGTRCRPAAPLVVAVAVLAATTGCGSDTQAQDTESAPVAISRSATWEPLPSLPGDLATNALDAQIVSVGSRPVLAFVDHSAKGRGAITVLSWSGQAWIRVGGRSLPPAVDGRFFASARGDEVCIATQVPKRILEQCASPQPSATWRKGPELERDDATTLVAYGTHARVTVLLTQKTARIRAGGRKQRVPTTNAFVQDGDRWTSAGTLERDGASQRPYLVEYRGDPCAVFNSYSTSGPPRQAVRVRCIADRRVMDAKVPDFTATRAARVQPEVPAALARASFGFDIAGATSTDGGRRLWIGVQVLRGSTADWVVYRTDPDANGRPSWATSDLGERTTENLGQGTLKTIGNEPWAAQFDQLGGTGAMRLSINRLNNGRKVRVGSDLANAAQSYGYPSLGVTEADGTVYATATVPNAEARRDELRVWKARNP